MFTNTPPQDPRGPALQIMRTPPGGNFSGIVTCNDLIGAPTHFFEGRTRPCRDDKCPACAAGIPWRWHAWISCVNTRTGQHVLFECTARPAQQFVGYRDAYKTLRGCHFQATRASRSPNGRVLIQTRPADLEKTPVPAAPDLIKILSIIWNIPEGDLLESGNQNNVDRLSSPVYDENTIEAIQARLDEKRALRRAAGNGTK